MDLDDEFGGTALHEPQPEDRQDDRADADDDEDAADDDPGGPVVVGERGEAEQRSCRCRSARPPRACRPRAPCRDGPASGTCRPLAGRGSAGVASPTYTLVTGHGVRSVPRRTGVHDRLTPWTPAASILASVVPRPGRARSGRRARRRRAVVSPVADRPGRARTAGGRRRVDAACSNRPARSTRSHGSPGRADDEFTFDIDAGFGEVLAERLRRFKIRVDAEIECRAAVAEPAPTERGRAHRRRLAADGRTRSCRARPSRR